MSICIRKLDELCAKIKELKEKQIDYDDNIEKLSKLYQLGLIDEEGNPVNKMQIKFLHHKILEKLMYFYLKVTIISFIISYFIFNP